jgi:phosphopantothenoylcysteine decarboxylase/phosphopantothenate--cysteine ligase
LKPVFLITAGPTREYLDPVRFFSNPSTGRMGYALARAARDRGAEVILVSGPVALRAPGGVRLVRVESANEMCREVMRRRADIIIMAAAVADYRPAKRLSRKVKKGSRQINVPMVRTGDILAELGRKKGNGILVGFAAETGAPVREASRKLGEKNLDMIVANDISRQGAGFASDYNRAVIIDRVRNVTRLPRMRKDALARIIVRRCLDLLP